jgi:DNA-3-methyladenine glycosylase
VRPGQAAVEPAAGLAERFGRPLPVEFYARRTTTVARALVGAWLVVRAGEAYAAARIVETEAYVANDPPNHADRGETPRNHSMFAGPGTLYVYRIHQVHCANAVTARGQAVLLRAAEPLTRALPGLSGPGRLCRGLGLDRSDDGTSLTSGRIRIVPGDRSPTRIRTTSRVGVSSAIERPLRFVWDGHPDVSAPRPWRRSRVT